MGESVPVSGKGRRTISWKGNGDLARVKGRDVTVRFRLKEGRLASFAFAESAAADRGPVECVFAADELPPANATLPPALGYRFRFVVRPVNSLGVGGKAIVSEWTSVEKLKFA